MSATKNFPTTNFIPVVSYQSKRLRLKIQSCLDLDRKIITQQFLLFLIEAKFDLNTRNDKIKQTVSADHEIY